MYKLPKNPWGIISCKGSPTILNNIFVRISLYIPTYNQLEDPYVQYYKLSYYSSSLRATPRTYYK